MLAALNEVQIWKSTAAENMRFLVNGEEYYAAIYDQIQKAEKNICILAWQLDLGTRLIRRDENTPGFTFEEVLLARLKEKPDLEVYILVWDHPLIYAQDREKFNQLKVYLNFPDRVHFRLDPEHPFWASHHAKLVIFDGRIAYSGGMDIATGRWDCSPHTSKNNFRSDSSAENYPPYHDVMVELQGPVIEPLIEYFRNRWEFSGNQAPMTVKAVPFKTQYKPKDLIPCHLVRTAPKYKEQEPIHEIEESYLALIASARKEIYIENQYISSDPIVEALGKRLQERHGPYVTIILPYLDDFSIEGLAMGTTVGVHIEKLMTYDKWGRLSVHYPLTTDTQEHKVKVHSKVMIVDDQTVMMGSANLNERSMGLDTELNFIFSAVENPRVRDHILSLKKKSLGCFLGKELREDELSGKKLQQTIDASPSFQRFRENKKSSTLELWADENLPLDYKEPLLVEQSLEKSINAGKSGTWKRIVRNLFVTAVIVAAVIYLGSNYKSYLQPYFDGFLEYLQAQKPSPWLLVIGFGILGGVFFPVNLFIIGLGLIYPTAEAVAYALIGVILASFTSFVLGKWIGVKMIKKLFKRKVSKFYTFFSKSHWTEIAVLRMVPFAPFSFIGLAAGAIAVPIRQFLIGSFLGNVPGVVLLLVFQKSLIEFVREPSWGGGALLVALVALFGFATYKIKKRFAYAS